MANITKKEFAAKCGWTGTDATRKLATYIGRGKVIANGDWVDDANEINMIFMAAQSVKAQAKTAPAPPAGEQPKKKRRQKEQPQQIPREETFIEPGFDDDEEEAEYMDVAEATQKKLHYQAEKLEKETVLKEMEIARKSGELIPAKLFEPIIKNHNQNIMVNFRNTGEDVIREFSKRYKLSNEDITAIRASFYESINKSLDDATAASVSSLEGIVNQYLA